MTGRTMVLRSGLSLVFYLALAGGEVVAQDAPRTELGARLAENHGDGGFAAFSIHPSIWETGRKTLTFPLLGASF